MDKRNLQRLLKILLVIGDIFFIAISFFITYYMRFYLNLIPVKLGIPDIRYYLYLMPFVVFFYLLSFNYSGLYIEIERKSIFNIFSKIFVSSLIAVVFFAFFYIFHKGNNLFSSFNVYFLDYKFYCFIFMADLF